MLWLFAAPALASGYYYVDSGARAIGRGGAWVVGADDLSAQYYNPAALSNVTRPLLNLQGWGAAQYVRFDRMDEPDAGLEFEPVENLSPPILEPSGGFATNLGGIAPILKNTYFAVGIYVPTAPYLAYDPEGPQRYQLQDSLIWQGYAGPSVAQRITPWLTIGAGLQYTFLRVEERLASTVCLASDPDDCADPDYNLETPSNDLDLTVKNVDPFQLSWNAGVIVRPIPQLEIGASVQPPIDYSAPGSLTAKFDEEFNLAGQIDGTEFTDPDTTLRVHLPLIVRAGVQVTPIPAVRIELDGTYTQWSRMSEFLITDVNMTVPHAEGSLILQEDIQITDDIVFKTGFQDAMSVRLGGDWRLNDWAQVRAGGHFETSAVPQATVGVNLPDATKFGFGAGATFTLAKRVALDIAFAQQLHGAVSISDSQVTQQAVWTDPLNPAGSKVVPGKVVGNGELSSSVTYLAIGATLYFGPGHGTDPRPN